MVIGFRNGVFFDAADDVYVSPTSFNSSHTADHNFFVYI